MHKCSIVDIVTCLGMLSLSRFHLQRKCAMQKRPTDINQLGKLLVDIATGEVDDKQAKSGKANGGYACAASITPERRKQVATKEAQARWKPGGCAQFLK